MTVTDNRAEDLPLSLGDLVLDRYRVTEQLAAGGYSVVYRGEDERLSRPVCIKVFFRVESAPGVWQTSYEHFVQEAFALSRLTHPNTLRIYDFGHLPARDDEVGGVPLQVSEFMNGGTLSQLVRESGPATAAETVRIMTMMCDALAEAHHVGIIHRDIKPQNILFATVGSTRLPKLADFGIAKAFSSNSGTLRNAAGDTEIVAGRPMVMYSPSWAAPEQLAGDNVTPSADIYSLALVTVYTLTGRAVFTANDIADGYRMRVRSDEILDTELADLDIPLAARHLLKQACSFAPEGRPQDVAEFALELREAFDLSAPRARLSVSGDALPLPPPPAAEPPPPIDAADGSAPSSPSAPPLVPRPPVVPTPVERPAEPRAGRQPVRMRPAAEPRGLGDRVVHFVPALGAVDLRCGPRGGTVRCTQMPVVNERRGVHLRALDSFIRPLSGRPTSAVQLSADGTFDLVDPRGTVLARARLSFGSPAAGHTLFDIGEHTVALRVQECPGAIVVDCGPSAPCYVVYAGQEVSAAERSERRGRRRS